VQQQNTTTSTFATPLGGQPVITTKYPTSHISGH